MLKYIIVSRYDGKHYRIHVRERVSPQKNEGPIYSLCIHPHLPTGPYVVVAFDTQSHAPSMALQPNH
ncbi:hypothetical protein E4T56_gene20858 [Termitomyces sp. T112]|nr:hypothetical protein E4T56_gene20858 [Termitomyces sp. T112]